MKNTSGIVVALQRQHALDFVAPIDVVTGGQTSNETLRLRYWIVFDKKTLDKIRPSYSPRHALARRMPYPRPGPLQFAVLAARRRIVVGARCSRRNART
jgi:hypothetical protein